MKVLSLRQAVRCETAKNPTCKCRCHGALHGKERGGKDLEFAEIGEQPLQAAREFFEALAEDDPHHIRSEEEKKKRRKIKRLADKAPLQMRFWPALGDQP